jgi:hypothetical protein
MPDCGAAGTEVICVRIRKRNSAHKTITRIQIFWIAYSEEDCHDGSVNDVTRLLGEMAGGDAKAGDKLIALVYGELRQMAAQQMGSQASQTLQPTALVHEAWLRLGGEHLRGGQNRAHFFCDGGDGHAFDPRRPGPPAEGAAARWRAGAGVAE